MCMYSWRPTPKFTLTHFHCAPTMFWVYAMQDTQNVSAPVPGLSSRVLVYLVLSEPELVSGDRCLQF